MVNLSDIKVGGRVWVAGGFGLERLQLVTVRSKEENIKNGRAGIDYTQANGERRWAYLEQVKRLDS